MLSRPHLVSNEIYRRSHLGRLHPLSIPRVSATTDLIRALGWLDEAVYHESPRATVAQLERFHEPHYVRAVQQAEEEAALPNDLKQRYQIGIKGNPIYGEVFRRPATACGATLYSVDLLKEGGTVHSPSGGTHHGRRDHASGFCYFNDIALGVLALLDQGLTRIVYVDLDAHHGDGVQDAFHQDDRVLTVSIHQADLWPYSGGLEDRAGGMARNLPTPAGLNDDEFGFLMENAVIPLVERFEPEAIIVQCGCDALADDPMSKLCLSNRAIWRAVDLLRRTAPRALFLGGGGYNPWAVARCWAGIWAALNDLPIPDRLPEGARAVLSGLSWRRSKVKTPPDSWISSLADAPRHGPIRPEIRAIPKIVLNG